MWAKLFWPSFNLFNRTEAPLISSLRIALHKHASNITDTQMSAMTLLLVAKNSSVMTSNKNL